MKPIAKELSWEDLETEQVAHTPFGTYRFFKRYSRVSHAAGGMQPVLAFACCDETVWPIAFRDDLNFEEARTLAQADFEAKVRACLG